MINLITEKKFFEDLMLCEKCEEIKDLMQFLKTDFFGYNLICDFNDVNEYREISELNPLWELLMDKYDNIIFNPNISNDLLLDSFYNSISEQSIFLVDKKQEICKSLQKERGLLFLSTENINSEWKVFNIISKGKHLKITTDPIVPNDYKLDSWNKLTNLFNPSTSIVIFDKYILRDKTNQKLTHNLFPLLKLACSHSNDLSKPFNLTIITEFERGKDIATIHSQIDSFFRSNNLNNIDFNIIKHDRLFYPSNFEGLHSRFILTNYFHFKCDDSFNFFKTNGSINNDADLRIDFTLSSKHSHFYFKEIKDVKTYVGNITNDPSQPDPERRTMFYNSKNNYLLN